MRCDRGLKRQDFKDTYFISHSNGGICHECNEKVTTALLAGMCLAGAVLPVVPNAAAPKATYALGDVNQDGVVDLLDVVCINKYLYGAIKLKEIDRLDINHNLIVDSADSLCLLSKCLNYNYSGRFISRKGNSLNFPINPKIFFYADEENGSRIYRKYSYISKKELDNYTLTLSNELISAQGNSLNKVVDPPDDRQIANGDENTGIVLIKEGGTGFIIGDHTIATAAHVVCDDTNSFHPSITIDTYDKNGQLTNKTLTPVEAHVPKNYVKNLTKYDEYDYALITVKEDLSDYVHFSLGATYNLTPAFYQDIPVYVTGCSQFKPREEHILNNERYLYSDEGRVIGGSSDYVIFHNVDTYNGQSGSPLYTITETKVGNEISYQYTAIGIHVAGSEIDMENWATRITRFQLKFYLDNTNKSYQDNTK